MLNIQIKRALISVSDKTNLIEFARNLSSLGVEIISTGGTYVFLKQNNIPAIEVADVTNFSEILDGRVKTLHPKIHGAILAKRDDQSHLTQLQEHAINPIDLVCVNLYPFESTINKLDFTFNDAIENIDIGGPAMIRASAKNHQHVVVVTNINDYAIITNCIATSGNVPQSLRLELAQKAFSLTAYYDSLISQYLAKVAITHKNAGEWHMNTDQKGIGNIDTDSAISISQESFPQELTIPAKLVQELRYGENAHQVAAFYKDSGNIDGLLASFVKIQGKELSYNNLADADTAWECVRQFMLPACTIVKHANPCGVALGADGFSSYVKAVAADPVSSFGGIIAFNCVVDAQVVNAIFKQFVEVLIAPEYTSEAIQLLAQKPNIRVLQIALTDNHNEFDYKRIGGGLLVQTSEHKTLDTAELKVVTQIVPSEAQYADLQFAWQVARMVKSNAIILVKNQQTIGVGAGQMSRIDSSKIAISKAHEFGFDVAGAVCASDAFFPFRDNVDLLAAAGVAAIIQPGGSIKDADVFAAADELNLAMVLTGYRIFRH
jgi:phosphoribosylaminoimidazolecarboxamide formyltransferase/IMP cyclohydrolase